jgi:hypothetical protein
MTSHDPEVLFKALDSLATSARDANDAFLMGRKSEGVQLVLKAHAALLIAAAQVAALETEDKSK